jgi:hypothetical protein
MRPNRRPDDPVPLTSVGFCERGHLGIGTGAGAQTEPPARLLTVPEHQTCVRRRGCLLRRLVKHGSDQVCQLAEEGGGACVGRVVVERPAGVAGDHA